MLFGAIEQTASFNVSAHMVDAETGANTGGGTIHVQDQNEIKLRMQELVQQTGAAPTEQARLAKTGAESEKALSAARKQLAGGDPKAAAATARAALTTAPKSVALMAVVQQADQQQKQAELEAARRAVAERARAEAEALAHQRESLAKQSEGAQGQGASRSQGRDEAARRA